MLAVRLLGRAVSGQSLPLKRTTCVRFLTGIVSGGTGLAVVWNHHRVHAASSKMMKTPIPPTIVRDVEEKKPDYSVDKFDWKLFWHYLKPQFWIIACATAVIRFSMNASLIS